MPPRATQPAPAPALEPLLTVEQVAELLQLKPTTVRAYVERGSLPCVRLNARLRFKPSDVALWVEERRSKGGR